MPLHLASECSHLKPLKPGAQEQRVPPADGEPRPLQAKQVKPLAVPAHVPRRSATALHVVLAQSGHTNPLCAPWQWPVRYRPAPQVALAQVVHPSERPPHWPASWNWPAGQDTAEQSLHLEVVHSPVLYWSAVQIALAHVVTVVVVAVVVVAVVVVVVLVVHVPHCAGHLAR